MRKNSFIKNGFTLIEVLISIVILSIIVVITSSFLQSSIQSKEIVFHKSAEMLKINLLGDILKEDLIHAANIPLYDFRGEPLEATFMGGVNSSNFFFVTRAPSEDMISKSLVQVQYLLEENKFLRRQFFAAAPSNPDDYLETVLLQGIKNFELKFSDAYSWYYFWPQGSDSQRKIPALVQVFIELEEGESFTWVVHPNISNAYE